MALSHLLVVLAVAAAALPASTHTQHKALESSPASPSPLHAPPPPAPPPALPFWRNISRHNPLFMLQAAQFNPAPSGAAWGATVAADFRERLPSALQSNTLVRLCFRLSNETAREEYFAAALQAIREAPEPRPQVVIEVVDPDESYVMPLPLVDELLTANPDIIAGINIAEMRLQGIPAFTFSGNINYTISHEAQYCQAAVELVAGRHGRLVFFQEDFLRWMHVSTDHNLAVLLHTMGQYPALVIPLNEMVAPDAISRQSCVLGLWLGDVVDNFGMEPQSWYWQNSLYLAPGVFGPNPNSTAAVPSRWYAPSILLNALSGSSVTSFEPFWDIWGPNSHVARETIFPMLGFILDRARQQHTIIPSKSEVLARARVAYLPHTSDSVADFDAVVQDLDFLAGRGRVAEAAYGLWRRGMAYEVVPDLCFNFLVPTLPRDASPAVQSRFDTVVHTGACNHLDVAGCRALLRAAVRNATAAVEPSCRLGDSGRAFVATVGSTAFVIHTRENLYERQAYLVAGVVGSVANVTWADSILQWSAPAWMQQANPDDWAYVVRRTPVQPGDSMDTTINAYRFTEMLRVSANTTRATVGGSEGGWAYAVTVLWTGRASGGGAPPAAQLVSVSGFVNYLDTLVFSRTESTPQGVAVVWNATRVEHWDLLALDDHRPASQVVWPLFKGVPAAGRADAQAIVDQVFTPFNTSYWAADWRGLTALYSPAYCGLNGESRNYVGRAFKFWFERFQTPFAYMQDRSWSLAGNTANVTLYIQLRSIAAWDEPWDSHGMVRIPRDDNMEVTFGLAKEAQGGQWRIRWTAPPLPNMAEMLWNVRGYASPHTLQPGVDEIFDRCDVKQY